MSSDKCFKCGLKGHWARDCTVGLGRGRGGFRRGLGGETQFRRGGATQFRRGGSRCFSFGRYEDYAISQSMYEYATGYALSQYECEAEILLSVNFGMSMRRDFLSSRKQGHIAKYCSVVEPVITPAQGQACYNCGEEGHIARDCPDERNWLRSETCYRCGGRGHKARECPTERGAACYMCGVKGHFARDCLYNQY